MKPTIADLTKARDIAARNLRIYQAQWEGTLPGALFAAGGEDAWRIFDEARTLLQQSEEALDCAVKAARTAVQKRDALLVLAADAATVGLGLIEAALTQIAGLDLADDDVCFAKADACESESMRSGLDYRNKLLTDAAKILRGVAS